MAFGEWCCPAIQPCPNRSRSLLKPGSCSRMAVGVRSRRMTSDPGCATRRTSDVRTTLPRARLSRPALLLHRHHVQPALDCHCRGGRTERARHLDHCRRRTVRPAGLCDARALVAISRGRRDLRLEQARLRSVPGFITAWSYWATNLPYFPSLLYFAAGNLLFVGGPSWQALVVQQHLLHDGLDDRVDVCGRP